MAAMALSGLCAILIGLTFGGPPLLTLLVAVVWGVTVIADSAQFSTAVTELAPAAYVGTALTTQTCLGFALTMVSIWLIPPVVAMGRLALGLRPAGGGTGAGGGGHGAGCGPCPRPGSWRAGGAESAASRAGPGAS